MKSKRLQDILFIVMVCVLIAIGILCIVLSEFAEAVLSQNNLPADKPAEGIARVTAAVRYLEPSTDEREYHSIEEYREGDVPVPAWYDPTEPMAAEWEDVPDIIVRDKDVPRKDAGCPDWNLDTTLWGWDGHGMEVWEFELFAKVVYLEFWGTSTECVEAGIDSMLLLWDMGEYGRTMGELLSSEYAPGYYVYSPYAYVWSWEYDEAGLEEIREMCLDRFCNGPEWCAPYFRKAHYHDDWGEWNPIPAYNIDNVYFSIPRG